MGGFAQMGALDTWYAHLSEAELLRAIKQATSASGKTGKADRKRAEKTAAKAHSRDSLQALSKLAEIVDGRYRIISQPPIVVPLRDFAPSTGRSVEEMEGLIHEQFRDYRFATA